MPCKSKNAQQKAAGIAKACASHHPSRASDLVLIPGATTPETSPSLGAEIITNLDNEEINEEIVLEGSRN